MSDDVSNLGPGTELGPQAVPANPIRVLLLDDREENLVLRSAILRQKGYRVVTSSSIEEAESKLAAIDIAVLDYHLGSGEFGTDVAETLRRKRPQVPIIILSATLERKFGGIADMHLLKGYSSVDDLVNALRSFEAKKRGRPVVVDARDFYYSRISMAMGDDIVLEVLDPGWHLAVCQRLLRRHERPQTRLVRRQEFVRAFSAVGRRVARNHSNRCRDA
jgi:two-component system, OmpR family, response regulator